jgi:hypothetical protein
MKESGLLERLRESTKGEVSHSRAGQGGGVGERKEELKLKQRGEVQDDRLLLGNKTRGKKQGLSDRNSEVPDMGWEPHHGRFHDNRVKGQRAKVSREQEGDGSLTYC